MAVTRSRVQNPAYRRAPLFIYKYTVMKPAVWRVVALSLIASAIAFACYQTTLPAQEDFGLHFIVPVGAPGTIKVTEVDPGSPAAKVGIRPGDIVSYGNTLRDRARILYATAGSRVIVTVNGSRAVPLTARRIDRAEFVWVPLIIRLAFLLVAALLAWRRPEDPAARSLVAFLWCYGLAISLGKGILPSPLLSLIVLQIANLVLFLLGTAAAAAFAAKFPSGTAKPTPRKLSTFAQILAVLTAFAVVGTEWVPRDANTLSLLAAGFLLAFILLGVLVLATLIVAYMQGVPSERERRRWVFLMLALGLAGPLVEVIVTAVFGYQQLVDDLMLIPLGLLPIGLAYVILRHRVIDIGFVINRAVVYTAVSIIIVAVFVIVETLLSKYVEQTSHAGSVAVQLVVALVLGFSVRAIHTRVDRFVDALLFRERHLAEAAIRLLALDAAYITDAGVLLSRCVKTVQCYTHARAAGVWISQSPTYHPAHTTFKGAIDVDENDTAVVAMRARRVVVELRETDSALPGVLAFPMIVRGELLGILVCGAKTDDEAYDPDERDALAALAVSVGHALDAIEIRDLRRRLEELSRSQSPRVDATDGGSSAF